jgi:site-specific recombinase XerD
LGDVTKHKLLKHRILIGLLYGCGLRVWKPKCTVARLGFDRKQQSRSRQRQKKDRYVPLGHLIRGLKKYIEAEKPQDYLLTDLPTGAGGDFDNRYSQRGVQWAVKQVAKAAGIIKVHTHTLRHYATHLLEDMDIMTLKDLWDIKC